MIFFIYLISTNSSEGKNKESESLVLSPESSFDCFPN